MLESNDQGLCNGVRVFSVLPIEPGEPQCDIRVLIAISLIPSQRTYENVLDCKTSRHLSTRVVQ